MLILQLMKTTALYAAFSMLTIGTVIAAEDDNNNPIAEACAPFEPARGNYQFIQEDPPEFAIIPGARVSQIFYTRLPIFDETDPAENLTLFRWANRVHLLTREAVISRQILFAEGQTYDQRLLEESGRLLRGQDYFYDVDLRPVSRCGDDVAVEVITKDTWSLTPGFSFDRSGGENTFSFSFRDSNILGLGKQLKVASKEDTDRHSRELTYEDSNVLGSRLINRSRIIDSDDGSNQLFALNLPFFSLDSRRSWGVSLENGDRIDEQFRRGDEITEVEHEIEDFSVELGFSRGLIGGFAQRWTVGYRYRRAQFSLGKDLPSPAVFPDDKELSYPFLGFELVEDNFDTAFNLDQIYRTEDLHLGHRFISRLGFAAADFGSDEDRVVLDGFYSGTLAYTENLLWQHSLEWEGLWNDDRKKAEDVVVSYESRYFRRINSRRSFFANFQAQYSKNLNTNRQIVFGGRTGARAFENRFQVGDRSVSLTLEERIYSDIHLLNLIRVGGALFVDVGRAWEPGVDNGVEDDLLVDIGIGLRLASSKAASGRVAHIDFAFPMTNRGDPEVDDFQFVFNIKSSF